MLYREVITKFTTSPPTVSPHYLLTLKKPTYVEVREAGIQSKTFACKFHLRLPYVVGDVLNTGRISMFSHTQTTVAGRPTTTRCRSN